MENWWLLVVIPLGYLIYRWKFRIYNAVFPLHLSRRYANRPPFKKSNRQYPTKNTWFKLLESSELSSNNIIKYVEIAGIELAVYRHNNQVYAVNSFCPHLGANFTVGGKVTAKGLVCPFHGLCFTHTTGLCSSSLKLKHYQVKEINHILFICLDPNPTQTWEVPLIREIEYNEWSYRGQTKHIVQAPLMENIAENAADLKHFFHVHRNAISDRIPLKHTWNVTWKSSLDPDIEELFIDNNAWRRNLIDRYLLKPYTSILTFTQETTLKFFKSSWKLPIKFSLIGFQIGSGIVYLFMDSTFGRACFIQTVVPRHGDNTQEIIHRLYCESKMPYWASYLLLAGEGQQVLNDAMIWSNKIHIEKLDGLLSETDQQIVRWRQWYAQFYSEFDKTVTPDLSW